MPNIRLKTAYDKRDRPILIHDSGQLDGGDAVDLGMTWYEPKGEQDPFFGTDGFYHFPDHPRNVEAVRRMKRVFKARGYGLKVDIVNGRGEDASGILHPAEVSTLSKRWVSVFGGDVRQAPPDVLALGDKLISRYHHHLANCSVLFVLEDYEPDKMGASFGIQGEVWGFCQKLGGEFRKLTGYDFKITFCEGIWTMLGKQGRQWLCDHELMHADRTENARWSIRDHDIEMFTEEVERYPKMGPLVDKLNRLARAKWADDDDDEGEDEEEPEVIEPEVKAKKKKKRKKGKGKKSSKSTVLMSTRDFRRRSTSQRALERAAAARVGVCSMPAGSYEWLKRHPGSF